MTNATYGKLTAGLIGAWFLLSLFASAGFRQFALTLNPRTMTMVQAWRIGGFVFLVLHAHGILPGIFALPAG